MKQKKFEGLPSPIYIGKSRCVLTLGVDALPISAERILFLRTSTLKCALFQKLRFELNRFLAAA